MESRFESRTEGETERRRIERDRELERERDGQTDRKRAKQRKKPVYTGWFLRGTTRWLGDEGTLLTVLFIRRSSQYLSDKVCKRKKIVTSPNDRPQQRPTTSQHQ